jgi:RNA polymerase sigma factor (sigma-70 family)
LAAPAPMDDLASETELPGSDGAFYACFIAPLEKRMMRTIWRIVRDADRARDVLQESLVTIWRRREIIESHPNPEALVLRICIHSAIGSQRTLHRRQRFEVEEGQLPQAGCPATRPPAEEDPTLEIEVRSAVRRLPENQAVALLLRVVEDEPYSAVAAALGCSEVTARIHVLRARRSLGRWLAHLAPAHVEKGGEK